ncbi:AMP-binding protein [Bdellovibrio svalbardensis]|uniref:AMP-binding protein n=1 Tax=Bdellovibrio svalbardensis TaxID=2972972 RepID=A0ABT6DJF8_9BACT|nr:AMP-binding protein [Bdellovibrio svalbardensis]MDG0817000.1 AMP-binding protein [Bdellovibrio svalbardensis]
MVSHQTPLDLSTDDNVILINPRFPKADFDKLYSLAESVQHELGLQAHVWIATSGSTADSIGSTKLVALSKKALIASAVSVNKHLQATAEDIWTQVLPHFHVGGLGIEIRSELAGSRVVPALKEGKWDAQHFYQTILKEKCTLSALVPTQVYDLVAHNLRAPETMRAIVVGGGVFDAPLYEQARALGWPVLPSYGMTETASQIATASLQSLQAQDYPEIELLSHADARSNEEGFLEVKALSLFTCYAQNTAEGARHWDPKIQGWFVSEDRGEVQGMALKISGRSKDYVKIGGEGTNVARLRAVLEQSALELNPLWPLHISLLDMPSERLGAEIHMVTTLNSSAAEKIANLYGEKVLPYEKIRKIHFVTEIPRTDLGKIQWSALRRILC